MVSLLSNLLTSAGTLNAYNQLLEVTQNNVANSSTPGYARQSQQLDALPLDIATGATGGVRAGVVQDFRDQYAEQNVWRQTVLLGQANQNVSGLTAIQSSSTFQAAQASPRRSTASSRASPPGGSPPPIRGRARP